MWNKNWAWRKENCEIHCNTSMFISYEKGLADIVIWHLSSSSRDLSMLTHTNTHTQFALTDSIKGCSGQIREINRVWLMFACRLRNRATTPKSIHESSYFDKSIHWQIQSTEVPFKYNVVRWNIDERTSLLKSLQSNMNAWAFQDRFPFSVSVTEVAIQSSIETLPHILTEEVSIKCVISQLFQSI